MLFKSAIASLNPITRRIFVHNNVLRYFRTYPTPEEAEEQMTITNDGNVIVCWHPEKPFPYEYSKPLPEAPPPSSTVLKMENKDEVYGIFKNKSEEQVRQELTKITFTTKHRWYPRARDRKAKKTKPDRPYL